MYTMYSVNSSLFYRQHRSNRTPTRKRLYCTQFTPWTFLFFTGNIGVIGLLLENDADILVYDKVNLCYLQLQHFKIKKLYTRPARWYFRKNCDFFWSGGGDCFTQGLQDGIFWQKWDYFLVRRGRRPCTRPARCPTSRLSRSWSTSPTIRRRSTPRTTSTRWISRYRSAQNQHFKG